MKKQLYIFLLLLPFFFFHPAEEIEAFCPPGSFSEQSYNDDNEELNEEGKPVFECQSISEGDGWDVMQEGDGADLEIMTMFRLLALNVGYFSFILSFFTVIYAGYLYTTSGGQTTKMEESKRYIFYAFLGMFFGGMSVALVSIIGGVFS
ncbi:hypothetical protein [Alkalibacillus aidingensis]|uniref:hypothetical protein n=1 Tax=Alkalibacillus aidingensis TaxID=2747607 RepID=UPI0016603430|nr:hypothetical protein [Alkalibacillus aidingensis]